jgi:hypothetical protein
MRGALLAVVASLVLCGCASQVVSTAPKKSYSVGQKLSAPVGGTLLRIETGRVEVVRRWVGVMNSPDGWVTETRASNDFVKGELVYGGISGRTIEIAYREYRGNLAAPAFFQNLKYDLAASPYIVFQNFRIEVLDASNSAITGVLVSDGAR